MARLNRRIIRHSFGAHFCEVSFDPEIVHLRVTRWVSVIDGGRMINQKTARNQMIGSVTMGIGMGMLEEAVYDGRNGHPINNNFADYMVAVNADVPDIECIFLDYPDTVMNEYDACGREAEFEESDRADVPFREELRTSQRPLVRLSSGRDILTTGGCASRGIHV